MIQNFDFHIHTSNSDGDYNIDEIIKKITENNIEYFAITDHDNIDSIEQLKDKFLERIYTENEIKYCESKNGQKYQGKLFLIK